MPKLARSDPHMCRWDQRRTEDHFLVAAAVLAAGVVGQAKTPGVELAAEPEPAVVPESEPGSEVGLEAGFVRE